MTKDNRDEFVSKVGSEIRDEFIISKLIATRLERIGINPFDIATSPGWFPLELQCLGKDEFFSYFVSQATEDTFKSPTREANNKLCDHILKSAISDKTDYVCFTQNRKYTCSLTEYNLRVPMTTPMATLFFEALQKLKILHSLNIYLFDIKPPNLALYKQKKKFFIFFTDWDKDFVFTEDYRYSYKAANAFAKKKKIIEKYNPDDEKSEELFHSYYCFNRYFLHTDYMLRDMPKYYFYSRNNVPELDQRNLYDYLYQRPNYDDAVYDPMTLEDYTGQEKIEKQNEFTDRVRKIFRTINVFLLIISFPSLFQFKNPAASIIILLQMYNKDFRDNTNTLDEAFLRKMIRDE